MKIFSKLTLLTLIVFFLVSTVRANHPAINWQVGHLVLQNQTVWEGDLSYNWAAEMVLFRQRDGRVHTFSANQVARFGWFDPSEHKQRNFVSLNKSTDQERPKQGFFEISLDGPLAVVRQLRRPHGLFKRAFNHPAYTTDRPSMVKNHDLFDYFVYDAGRLLALDRFYPDIYAPLMTAYDQELRRYVSVHNLNERSLQGRLVLIDHYNWLVQQDAKTASARRPASVPD